MTEERRHSAFGTTVLVGGVLLVVGVSLVILLAPLYKCPNCGANGLTERLAPTAAQEALARKNIYEWKYRPAPCAYCVDRRWVSPLKKWTWTESDAPKPPIYRALP